MVLTVNSELTHTTTLQDVIELREERSWKPRTGNKQEGPMKIADIH